MNIKEFGYLLKERAIYLLISITVLVYVFTLFGLDRVAFGWLSLMPKSILRGEVWRLVTYGFVHSLQPMHVLFNMVLLWMFGREFEERWGYKNFILVYLLFIVLSGMFAFIPYAMTGAHTLTVGASGAVLAFMSYMAFRFPERQILLFFVLPVKMIYLVYITGVFSLAGTLRSSHMGFLDGSSHSVHLGGIVMGWLLYRFEEPVMHFLYRIKPPTFQKKKKTQVYTFEKKEPTVDDILRKINKKGMGSLTNKEKEILEKASKKGNS